MTFFLSLPFFLPVFLSLAFESRRFLRVSTEIVASEKFSFASEMHKRVKLEALLVCQLRSCHLPGFNHLDVSGFVHFSVSFLLSWGPCKTAARQKL